jgi:anaerobic ribonucleoside-triphosphate reductase activating protein
MFPALPYTKNILSSLDVLVDGRFEQDLLDLKLKFRGSRNQRVLDIPQTLKQ